MNSYIHTSAIILLAVFLAVSPALPITTVTADSARSPRSPEDIVVPVNLGSIAASTMPARATVPPVVILQDLHGDPAAQRAQMRILDDLDARYRLSTIFLEGVPEGPVGPSILACIPSGAVRGAAADDLLDAGLLSGAERWVLDHVETSLQGMERWQVYWDNILRAQRIAADGDATQQQLQQTRTAVEETLSRRVPRAVVNLDRALRNDNDPRRYARYPHYARKYDEPLTRYPNLYKYVSGIALLKKAGDERQVAHALSAYVQELKGRLPYNQWRLVSACLRDTAKTATLPSMLSPLKDLRCPPRVKEFIEGVQLIGTVNPMLLLEEDRLFREKVLARAAGPQAMRMFLMADMLARIADYATLRITPDDHAQLEAGSAAFQADMLGVSAEMQPVTRILSDETISAYHRANIARNEIFADAILRGLQALPRKKTDRQEIAVAVAGGFHVGLADALAKRGVPVVLVTPRFAASRDREKNYHAAMTGTFIHGYPADALMPPRGFWLKIVPLLPPPLRRAYIARSFFALVNGILHEHLSATEGREILERWSTVTAVAAHMPVETMITEEDCGCTVGDVHYFSRIEQGRASSTQVRTAGADTHRELSVNERIEKAYALLAEDHNEPERLFPAKTMQDFVNAAKNTTCERGLFYDTRDNRLHFGILPLNASSVRRIAVYQSFIVDPAKFRMYANDAEHGLLHSIEVARISLDILRQEGSSVPGDFTENARIILAVSVLHDMTSVYKRDDHNQDAAALTHLLLPRTGYDDNFTQTVAAACLNHRGQTNIAPGHELTPVEKIFIDADELATLDVERIVRQGRHIDGRKLFDPTLSSVYRTAMITESERKRAGNAVDQFHHEVPSADDFQYLLYTLIVRTGREKASGKENYYTHAGKIRAAKTHDNFAAQVHEALDDEYHLRFPRMTDEEISAHVAAALQTIQEMDALFRQDIPGIRKAWVATIGGQAVRGTM